MVPRMTVSSHASPAPAYWTLMSYWSDQHRPLEVRRRRFAQPQVDALLAVDVGQVAAELGAQHALQRLGHRLEHGDGAAAAAGGGRHLASDESGSDHLEPPSSLEYLT